MNNNDEMEYLKLSKFKKFLYRFVSFFTSIPKRIWNGICGIGRFFKNFGLAIGREATDIVTTFIHGDWKTKLSYLVMGFGCLARGQILRGVLFLLFEVVFIFYMFFSGFLNTWGWSGAGWLKMLGSLGTRVRHTEYKLVYGVNTPYYVEGHPSFKILLYGVLTIFFVIAFIYTWRVNIKQNKIAEQILKSGKPLKSGKDDLRSLVDDNFHRTLLALPMTGIVLFTVMPIVFMVLVAFTNYDDTNNGVKQLIQWQGLGGFNEIIHWKAGGENYSAAFGEILVWTLIWAFFATFTNYFLGMFVAMMINKKGIKLKKLWRTILILTIAIPQFISLLYVSQLFEVGGVVNGFLQNVLHVTTKDIDFWGSTANNALLPRVMVILINIWIGIPYLMLIATGILMNIPADLYESSKIDGASGWKQFSKITLPYMLFITGPYLLTSFTGNMNNFNVIYLLTGGRPDNTKISGSVTVGHTDLLITWLYKLAMKNNKYYLASVVGVLVFIVVSLITLVVYGLLPSVKNEEDFQ